MYFNLQITISKMGKEKDEQNQEGTWTKVRDMRQNS